VVDSDPEQSQQQVDQDEAERKHEWKIYVNTKEKEVSEKELTFDKVVELAQPLPSGPNYEYTVDYRKAAGEKHKGELMPGETVEIKDGTIFDVTATDKS
jgi:Multiubiquitin